MKLAVQLVAWNGEKYIPYLFESLRKQTYRDWELLVWDNHSTDETLRLIAEATVNFPVPVRITKHHENRGFAFGHNRLFRENDSPYVLLLNQDMRLAADCLEQLMQHMEAHPDVSALTARLMRWDFDAIQRRGLTASLTGDIDALGLKIFRSRRVVEYGTKRSWAMLAPQYGAPAALDVFGVSGAFPLFRRAALEDIAFADGTFFDESYHAYKEDVDLAYRLQARGHRAQVLLNAVAYHDRSGAGPKEFSDAAAARNKKTHSPYTRYHSYKNHLVTLYKNEYWQNFLLDLPWILWYEVKKFLWLALFDRTVVKGLREAWRMRNELREKRQWIRNKRRRDWNHLRRWWI